MSRTGEAIFEASSHGAADIPDHTQDPLPVSDRALHFDLGSRRYSLGGQTLGEGEVLVNISAHDCTGVPNRTPASLPDSTLHHSSSPSHLQQATLPTSEGSHPSPYASLNVVQVIASPPNTSTPLLPASSVYTTGGISIPQLLHPASHSPESHHWAQSPSFTTSIPATLTYHEAYLVHHYAENLGRWLDCTDASRHFTLKIPILVKTSPILLHAVVSFAARHVGDTEAAEVAHQRCLELLILLLDSDNVADDDMLLCAIVILRVFEQLKGNHLLIVCIALMCFVDSELTLLT